MKKTSNTTKEKRASNTITTPASGANITGAGNIPGETPDPFFAEPVDPVREGREQGLEVIRHLLIWMAEAPTLEKRGLRATIALHCLRPDLIHGITLQKIGMQAGCTRQRIHKLMRDFEDTMGLSQ